MSKSLVRKTFASFTLFFCLHLIQLYVVAQNSTILSKRPAVLRSFDPDTRESTVSALLIDPDSDDFRGMLVYSADHPPPAIRFHSVEYKYPGKIFAPPQSVAFIFVPLDKYKTAPSFSITAEGAIVHQGEATLKELCCVNVNGHSDNPQNIVLAVPMESFERLTKARKVEIKLTSKRGAYSFKLKDYQKTCLVALANTMK